MTDVLFCDAFLKDFARYFANYKYIALDSDSTASSTSQSAPITELDNTYGAGRAAADTSFDADTGICTLTKKFVFSGPAPVKAVCPMNNATKGQGIGMYRYIPPSGVLPDAGFDNGGSLSVTITCSNGRAS